MCLDNKLEVEKSRYIVVHFVIDKGPALPYLKLSHLKQLKLKIAEKQIGLGCEDIAPSLIMSPL
jgi:hypothetical protein